MKILFITNETDRTGAPIMLLEFLKWIKSNHPDVQIDVLALKGGALSNKFQNNCDRLITFEKFKTGLFHSALRKFKIVDSSEFKIKSIAKNKYNIIYANTIITVPIALNLKKYSQTSKIIAHIHELNTIIKMHQPKVLMQSDKISAFVAPSEIVKLNLINNYGIRNEKIKVVYECTVVSNKSVIQDNKQSLFKVGASGVAHWRKGYDIFILVAHYIKKNHPNVKIQFEWIGKVPEHLSIIIAEDIRKLNLEDVVFFIGEVPDASIHFANLDLFLMTSREDPFPLVCIEIGMLGKPIISFDKAVGTNEILIKQEAFIVPYLDIEEMAEKIILYYNNPELLKLHGERNKKAFNQFTPEIICPQLFEILTEQSNN